MERSTEWKGMAGFGKAVGENEGFKLMFECSDGRSGANIEVGKEFKIVDADAAEDAASMQRLCKLWVDEGDFDLII